MYMFRQRIYKIWELDTACISCVVNCVPGLLKQRVSNHNFSPRFTTELWSFANKSSRTHSVSRLIRQSVVVLIMYIKIYNNILRCSRYSRDKTNFFGVTHILTRAPDTKWVLTLFLYTKKNRDGIARIFFSNSPTYDIIFICAIYICVFAK